MRLTKLDRTDIAILAQLQQNGRITNINLAHDRLASGPVSLYPGWSDQCSDSQKSDTGNSAVATNQ